MMLWERGGSISPNTFTVIVMVMVMVTVIVTLSQSYGYGVTEYTPCIVLL
jgi:hypothetical protein